MDEDPGRRVPVQATVMGTFENQVHPGRSSPFCTTTFFFKLLPSVSFRDTGTYTRDWIFIVNQREPR